MIEGAASYGAILGGTVAAHGYPVTEAPRMNAEQHRGVSKSDALDTHQTAAAVLPLPTMKLRQPRLSNGVRQAIPILVTARNTMSKDRSRSLRSHLFAVVNFCL